ncbi:MAG: DUF4397 domain-containing protein [Chitinophagaceae bacterium]|nr:DUF4397 domain-containing protein [Chitinophagaceae bacterium]
MKKNIGLLLTFVAGLLLSSCLKNANTGISDGPKGYVKILNASVDAPPVDLYTETGTKLNSNTQFGAYSNYTAVDAGGFNFRLNATGTTAYLVKGSIVTSENAYYTLIMNDSTSKIKAGLVSDEYVAPASGKAKIRFFHLISNGGAYDLYLGSNPLFSGRTFNDYKTIGGGFIEVNAGTVNFDLKNSGVLNSEATLSAATLTAGKFYTLIAVGTSGAVTGQGSQLILLQDTVQ